MPDRKRQTAQLRQSHSTAQPTLLVGGERAEGMPFLSLADLHHMTCQAREQDGEPYHSVLLQPPLDPMEDAWALLRGLWDYVVADGTLTVRYGYGGTGFHLRGADVGALLRLAGFEPSPPSRKGSGFEMTAQRRPRATQPLTCTVVVPCRNEVGNVDALVRRVPQLGSHTEILFVDGASTDGTPERIEELIAAHPEHDIKLLRQHGRGKADAVYLGFDRACGDVLLILDADMTVAPEDLPRFYLALAEGVADFANGSRFVYPMEAGAMPQLNNLGNRVFGLFLSWLLETHITDSLCGTKALLRRDWMTIARARPRFGGHDPWGDFDLLMGAAYAGLRLIDIPVRYGARTAGESKMRPMRHGVSLARSCLAGIQELKLKRRRLSLRSR